MSEGIPMNLSQRSFLEQSAFSAAALTVLGVHGCSGPEALRRSANIRVGATDWNLAQEGKIAAFALGKEAGVDGIQVSLGKNDEKKGGDKLPMTDPERQKQWLE